ncbi:hypothetical protein DE146DRAFT_630052 [Phaeosphaeria sp. MPI-PUGE-AT-0046c]|nr:hypothetical protein DE146DRAFT_630052 [Phaeosphaeria sp. MPI-PUGE-AT-0046c]
MVSYSMVPQPEIELDTKPRELLHVQENQINSANAVYPPSPTQHAHQPLRKRLGTWSILVLALSTFTIFAIVIFLSLLWQYGNNPSVGYNWAHNIALKQFTVKIITLSSVVMRLMIALQAGICTSLAAALILERNSVPLPDLLHFAAIRSLNSGPPTILYPIGRQFRFYMRSLPAVLILGIFITTTLLQLSSTLLVIDTGPQLLDAPAYEMNMNFTNNKDTNDILLAKYSNIDYWGSRPLAYYPFGERQGHSKQAENMHDTGIIYQGMSPSSDPYWIRDARGLDVVTTVFASRVACVAPTVEATIQQVTDDFFTYLIGNMTIDRTANDLLHCESNDTSQCIIAFNCSLPSVSMSQNVSAQLPPVSDWMLGVCAIQQNSIWSFGSGSLFDTANSTVNATEENLTDDQGIYVDISMVLNHTGLEATRPKSDARFANVGNYTKRSQEWSTYKIKEDESIDVSLCFSKWESQHKFVKMKSNRSFDPIEVRWDSNNGKYDTTDVQRLFDISNQLVKKGYEGRSREIMEMEMPRFDDTKIPVGNVTKFWQAAGQDFFNTIPDQASHMLPGCFRCAGGNSINLHPHMSSLFQDIVKRTGHPALALQTIYSIITQSAYYEDAAAFNVGYNAIWVTIQLAVVPLMWFGFLIVTGLLAFHLIMVASMVFLFAKRTKYSMVGEMWHSMGQVMEHVPEHLLHESMGRTDVEIRKACRRSGTSRSGVSLYRDSEVGEGQVRERI